MKYIDADELISALNETIEKHQNSDMFTRTVRAAKNMITIIKQMPSADVVEVKHGEWIDEEIDCNGIFVITYCSECKEQCDYRTDFCPNCGADMRGETE